MEMDNFQFHDMRFTWLDGGMTWLDGGAMFGVVPKPLWTRKYEVNDHNQIPLPTHPILVQYGDTNYLVDSGIGSGKLNDKQKRNFGVTRESHIEESLHMLGLSTADIDVVLMTHMHFDHASGLTRYEGDVLVPVFENATIYVSDVEWNELCNPNIRSKATYWRENWEPIQHQVKTFKDTFEVVPGITMEHTGGHSDGHAVIRFEQQGDTLIHMGDILATTAHQNPLWVMAYDDYPMTSVFAKERLTKEILERGYFVSFYHDNFHRVIKWDTTGKEVLEEVPVTHSDYGI